MITANRAIAATGIGDPAIGATTNVFPLSTDSDAGQHSEQ
jgi:hypothetical protein